MSPKEFKQALDERQGREIVVWLNSPGGDVFAASSMYTMLKEYPGKITVKVDGMAASAASVVAMAADELLMSPPSALMIHNPWVTVTGDARQMERTQAALKEIGDGIAQAYQMKTGKSKDEILKMMDEESWMSAPKAVELGFADGVLYEDGKGQMQPAACVLTARGVYAYGGAQKNDAEMQERQKIANAARQRLGNNKK